MNLIELFENISPAELAALRGKQQQTSTRDKKSWIKKIKEIQDVLDKLNYT
jgi:hypothetical protein